MTARPSRRLSRSAIRPPSANSSDEAIPVVPPALLVDHDPARHAEVQPEVGAAASVSAQRNLPRRLALVSLWPTSAAAISPGACGRQT